MKQVQADAAPRKLYGVAAEFETPADLLAAIRALRQRGYARLDALTPFPVHGLNEALGLRRSPLGWAALAAGLAGASGALLLQWWTGAVAYPVVVGGKPYFAVEPSVPVTFELAVLLASFAAVLGMLALNGLPRFYHAAFHHTRYQRASDDAFLLVVESDGPGFDAARAAEALRTLGGQHVEILEEECDRPS
jgi:hypothetical protein